MRGPYEGTWQQGIRPTVVMAPDALVYINGETEIIGCASCHRRFDLNKYITSIQVDLNVDSAPGSANISMSIPRHSIDEFYFDGNPMITPMMEVEIFAKGYFLVEGLPQYYPIFWGMTTEVSDSYSGGEHTFTINCADILKWWELCKMNINPAFTQGSGQLGKSIFGNVLFGSNPYDMIWALAQQSFGDVVVGSGSLVSFSPESKQKETFNVALADIMQYWNRRFSKIRSNLLLYGTQGNAVRGDLLYATYQKQGGGKKFRNSKAVPFASQAVRQANGGEEGSQMVFDPTSPSVTAFRTQFNQAGQVNFWTSEFQTKLEIANACKEAIGFEFYMDVTGDIVFKPPFYNLDILSNKPVSWIQDIDIIDWDLSESEAEVVTQVQLQGSFGGNVDYGFGEEATPGTSVTDYHMLRKYGWRVQTFNSEFSGNPQQMYYMGLDMLDRYNSKRHRGTVNIPLRPELRLGFPIYLAPKDQVWYVSGLSHSISFGGRAQTTLTLTAKRSKFLAPRGVGTIELTGYSGSTQQANKPAEPLDNSKLTTKQLASGGQFKATVGDAAQLPPTNYPDTPGAANPYEPLVLRHPKTGRLCGYPNVVMVYTRPFKDVPSKDFSKVSGQKDPNATRPVKASRENKIDKVAPAVIEKFSTEPHTVGTDDVLRQKYLNNRYSYGLNSAGVYTYLHDKSSVMKEIILLPAKNIQFDENNEKLKLEGSSGMIRPVSDERGFEVIGHFRYGRGVSLRDGSLVLNVTSEDPAANNSAAQINLQLAMSGDLTASLQAQAQGLTVQNTFTANPALTLAKLQPEDLQTAAVMNPDSGEATFVNTDTNFIDTAPLGSSKPGVDPNSTASVEAAQLSRALTLAEMAVKEDILPQDECDCLLGRSELAFINVGYQIRVLGVSSDANATIKFGSLTDDQVSSLEADAKTLELMEGENAAAEAAEAAAQKINENDPLWLINPEDAAQSSDARIVSARTEAINQYKAEHADEYAQFADESQSASLAEAIRENKPVADTLFSHGQTISKVEAFLATLYSALDTSHQEYEKGLRGEYIPTPEISAEDIRFGTIDPDELGTLGPPFNAAGRAVGGDPIALATQANDAFNEAVDTWDDFGASLQADLDRAELEQEIAELQQEIAALQLVIDQQQAVGPVDPDVQAEMDRLLQELANKQQELNILNQEYPPP